MAKLLIVEDDQFLADAYRLQFVRANNWEIDVVGSGREAITALKEAIPDLMILDIVMPNKSGLDVLTYMKEQKISIPVIVASNLDSKNATEKALALGATDYFIKSELSIVDLEKKIKEYLDNKQPKPAA